MTDPRSSAYLWLRRILGVALFLVLFPFTWMLIQIPLLGVWYDNQKKEVGEAVAENFPVLVLTQAGDGTHDPWILYYSELAQFRRDHPAMSRAGSRDDSASRSRRGWRARRTRTSAGTRQPVRGHHSPLPSVVQPRRRRHRGADHRLPGQFGVLGYVDLRSPRRPKETAGEEGAAEPAPGSGAGQRQRPWRTGRLVADRPLAADRLPRNKVVETARQRYLGVARLRQQQR